MEKREGDSHLSRTRYGENRQERDRIALKTGFWKRWGKEVVMCKVKGEREECGGRYMVWRLQCAG